jgi:hydroxymethylbilane synthase
VAALRLGTRASALALAQAEIVREALVQAHDGLEVEVVPVSAGGDEGGALALAGDKSRFVRELEQQLLAGGIDVALHSAKDVPGDLPAGLAVAGVPGRASPLDALCGAASLAQLAPGARVGTSSLRRRAQLLARRADLVVEDLRGNVDTRLRKLAEGSFDALVLASAGLARLGRAEAGEELALDEMVPAPGQGSLLLEARSDDERVHELAHAIDDPTALTELTAERALVAALGASCNTPIGCHADLREAELRVTSFVGLPDGSHWIGDEIAAPGDDPGALGRAAAQRLGAAGAAELLEQAEAAATLGENSGR